MGPALGRQAGPLREPRAVRVTLVAVPFKALKPGPCTPTGTLSADIPLAMTRSSRQRRGAWAEQRTLQLLRSRGWQLLDRNWSCRWGELDLVVAKPGRLLLVEVKGRRQGSWDGDGQAALGVLKRQRLARAWACWIASHPDRSRDPVELVAALVPLPPWAGAVRWIRLELW